jgi:hypothetical protein
LDRVQIGEDSGNGFRSRIAPVAKVENEAGIAHGISAEAGWRDIRLAQKFLYLSKQMHG